jgi:FkbM family methyltransferase
VNTDSNVEYIPLSLSNHARGITLTITSNRGCSSVYPPIKNLYERYPGCAIMRPLRSMVCSSTTLDNFIRARGIDTIDAIKLDTQGSELDILKGAERALQHCKLIVIEVEFNALYEGQPLFCDVDRFLRDRGFVLWRFHNLAHYSTGILPGEPHSMLVGTDPGGHQYVAFANGQLFWADAFYVKEAATSVNDKPLAFRDAVVGAVLVSQWHFWDLAIEMIRKSGDAALLSQLMALINLEKNLVPGWTRDRYSAAEFRSNGLPVVHPFS